MKNIKKQIWEDPYNKLYRQMWNFSGSVFTPTAWFNAWTFISDKVKEKSGTQVRLKIRMDIKGI